MNNKIPILPEIVYSCNLSNTIIRGVNLALCNGSANGYIKGNAMKLLSYNNGGKCVSMVL